MTGQQKKIFEIKEKIKPTKTQHNTAYFSSSTVLKQCKTYRDFIIEDCKISESCREEKSLS